MYLQYFQSFEVLEEILSDKDEPKRLLTSSWNGQDVNGEL